MKGIILEHTHLKFLVPSSMRVLKRLNSRPEIKLCGKDCIAHS